MGKLRSRDTKSLDERAGTGPRQLSSRDHALYHDTFDKTGSHLRKQQSQDLIHPPCQGMFHSTTGHLKPRGDGKTCTQGKANDKCNGQAGAPDQEKPREHLVKETKGLCSCSHLSLHGTPSFSSVM